jgi:predicted lipoprotein with Yx(FWY)xxD motif
MRWWSSRGYTILGFFALLSIALLAACGTSGSGGLYGSGGGSTPPAASSTPVDTTAALPGAGIVATTSATVGGQSATILTDPHGHTLYFFSDDSATTSACTTGCTADWPPLLVSSGAPTSTSALPGTLSALDVGNGMQVLYNGHPLYRYAGDSAPGDTHGDGIEGKWHIATPTIATNHTPTGQPSPTKCAGYYCS